VLGDMYDKFETFNLQLNSIGQSCPAATISATLNVRAVNINIAGLPFLNQTYSVANLSNTYKSLLTTYKFANTDANVQIYNNNSILTFNKHQELANINLFYAQLVDGAVPAPTNPYPNMVFQFTIYGVTKVEDK
jgi:hypothetical protein